MAHDDLRQLLLDTHRGDRHAAVRLHSLIAPRMLAYARGLLRHDAAAEDSVQQVFVQLLALHRDELAAVTDVLPWLIRLTRNAGLNHARATQRMKSRERARLAPPRTAAGDSGLEDLLCAVERLDDDDRELVLLKHIVGLTFEQMALSLGENRSTIASRYRAAIGRLQSSFANPLGVPHG